MLPPDFLTNRADEIVALYEQLANDIAKDIARRIVRMGDVSYTSAYQMEILQQAGMVYDDAIKQIANIVGKSDAELRQIFVDAGTETLAYDDAIYKRAGLSPIPLAQSPAMLQTLTAGLSKTSATLQNLTATTAISSQQAFIQASTNAYMQTISGATSYAQAVSRAMQNIATEGSYVLYPSGHRDRIDVAVRRNVLTGVSQTAGKLQEQRADEMGVDLMQIDAHMGARPSHANFQGRIVSRSDASGYLSLRDIGYGDGWGFKGYNCRHDWYPYIEGISRRRYTDEQLQEYASSTVEYDGKTMDKYAATQKQRAMERNIRDSKRQLSALDEAMKAANTKGDKSLAAQLRSDFESKAATLKKREAKYKEFANQTGLPRYNDRTQVYGFGRSTAQKAVAANKRVVAKTATASGTFIRHRNI